MAITTSLAGDREKAAAAFKSLFPGHSPEDVAKAAGAIDGSRVEFFAASHDLLGVQVHHPHLSAFRFFSLHRPDGQKPFITVEHSSQTAHSDIRGQGYKRFAEAVQHLQKIGVSGISMSEAAGSHGSADNGFYTWPRFGFQGQLTRKQFSSLPEEIQAKMGSARDFHTLFSTPGGAEAWQKVGTPTSHLHFDLREGSEHLRRFREYHATREQRQASTVSGSSTGTVPAGVQQSDSPGAVGSAGTGGTVGGTSQAQGGSGLEGRLARGLKGLKEKFARARADKYAVRTSTVRPGQPYKPSDPAAPPVVGSPDRNREWAPKYPGFAVSPEQGLYDKPSDSQPFESAPPTSHLIGWRLQGGGFVKRFYGPTVNAPKGTSQIISVRFKDKKRGHSQYEYYFTSSEQADEWVERLRAADHPGKVIWQMIRAEIPYKRKYRRGGETVVRYSRSYLTLVGRERPVRFAVDTRKAHPLIRGFRIEHALRHLTNDPAATEVVKQLASTILYDGRTDALYPLNDALEEQEHPLHRQYNWANAAHKIHVDDAVGEAVDTVAQHEEEPILGDATRRLYAVDTLLRTHESRHRQPGEIGQTPWEEHPAVAAAHDALDELDPHIEAKDISESLHRHQLRANDDYHERAFDGAKSIQESALDPLNVKRRWGSPEQIEATRYARVRRPIHPFIKGTRLAVAVKSLTDPRHNSETTTAIARAVLRTGDTTAIGALADHLDEIGHPLADAYDWRAAMQKLGMDTIVEKALRSNTHRWSDEPGSPLAVQVEGSMVEERLTNGSRDLWKDWPTVEAVTNAVREQYPDATDHHILGSVRRVTLKALDQRHTQSRAESSVASERIRRERRQAIRRAALTPEPEPAFSPSVGVRPVETPKTLAASRFLYRRDTAVTSPLAVTFNEEINKAADRLHQKQGVADIDEFKQHDHYGRLLSAARGDHELATDTATDLIFNGTLERRHRPGQPLLPVVNNAGRFSGRAAQIEKQRQLGGIPLTDLRPTTTDLPTDFPEEAAVAKSVIQKPQSPRTTEKKQWQARIAASSDTDLGKRLIAYLQRRGPMTVKEIYRVHLPLPAERIKQIADQAGAVSQTTRGQGKPGTTLYPPGSTPPPDQKEETRQKIFKASQAGVGYDEIARQQGMTRAQVSSIIQQVRKRLGLHRPRTDMDDTRRELLAEVEKGKSLSQIARERQKTPQAIGLQVRIAKQKGLTAVPQRFRRAVEDVVRLARKKQTDGIHQFAGAIQKAHDDARGPGGRWNGASSSKAFMRDFTHDVFADYLAETSDPREHLVRKRASVGEVSRRVRKLGLRYVWGGDYTGPATMGNSRVEHDFSDGTRLAVLPVVAFRATTQDVWNGTARPSHYHVGWRGPAKKWYNTLLTSEEFGDFLHKFPDAEGERLRITYQNHPLTWQAGPDIETPEKMSRRTSTNAADDFVSALRRVRSRQQDVLRKLADSIHTKLKLKPTTVRDAVWDRVRVAATANTVQALYHGDPDRAKVAAAWYGLQSQTPSILVFHVDPAGSESVHKISVAGSGEKLRSALTKSGLHQRTMLPTKDGWDVLVYDRSSTHSDRVQQIASAHGGSVSVSRGRGEIIGGPDVDGDGKADSGSRRTYRSIIRSWEQQRQEQQRVQKPVQQSLQPGTPVTVQGVVQPTTAGR